MRIVLVCLTLLAPALFCAAQAEDSWRYVGNEHVRVGVDLARGGGIGYFSAGDSGNLINNHDTGRFIQQSYYGDPDGSRWANRPWVYNPVQGGSYNNNPAQVTDFNNEDGTLYTRTIPCNWARPGQNCPEAIMEQWITTADQVAHIRFKLTYTGPDHAPRHQEMPAVFVDYIFTQLALYDGDQPWTGGELTLLDVQPTAPPRNARVRSTEHWFAYVDPTGRAIGVYTPGTSDLTYYRFRGDRRTGPNAGACSYFAPIRTFALTQGLVVEYDVYLTLGTLQEVRARFAAIHDAQEATE